MNLSIDKLKMSLGEFSLECSLDLPPGRLITLLGPSGCGKTSLLKSIAGLYTPASGRIHLGGRDITDLDPRFRKIGMVFQDYALFPHMSVQKNITYGMPKKGEEARRRCAELLEMVELPGFENRRIEELSGGEKQRIALARALASEPDLLLLDEPLSALDARLRKTLRRQIREIQMETGITTVYVTHDQEEAMAISDLVVLMKDGEVVQTGSPEEIYLRPDGAFAADFFGTANLIPLNEAGALNNSVRKAGLLTGDAAERKLFFRPEYCRTGNPSGDSAEGTEEELHWTGRVLYAEYGGDYHYLELDCGGYTVRVKSREAGCPAPGEEMEIAVSLSDCLVL
ncbi:MAG: ABC transporter ATP-binding protein [Spirochaetales bacterium]|nr:ABC transporter ATP-binding protein [Spirochaetales bacterium]